MYNFPVWKTITLGQYPNATALLAAFKTAGGRVGDRAVKMMTDAALEISSQPREVDLVFADHRDLGFREGEERNFHVASDSRTIHDVPHYDKFCVRALELGLEMCPGEVGPVLRLDYMDQPSVRERKDGDPGSWLRIAMKAAVLDGMSPGVFLLENDYGKRRLMWDTRWPHFICPTSKFVFIRPR